MRLTRKLLLLLVASIVVILGASGLLQVRQEVALLDDETARDDQLLGKVLASAVVHTWRTEGRAAAMALIESEGHGDHVKFRWLEGDRTYTPYTSGDIVYTFVPVVGPSGERGTLELAERYEQKKQYIGTTIRHAVWSTAVLILTCATVASLIGFWFVGRPSRLLVEKARRVGAGDLGGPLHLRQRDELGELAKELNLMCERLEEASAQLRHADRLKTVGMLAAGIAHELGTPLNVVAGRAEMIESGDADPAQAARTIGAQTERMAKIIRQLLDFARPSSGTRAPAPLGTIAAQTVTLLKSLARKQGVTLREEHDEPQVTGRVDAEQLQQVLANLVVNALHATKSGGSVVVRAHRTRARAPADLGGAESSWACIEVRDTGSGMDDETAARIFEPFFTTKQVGEGTGLGLSVAYGIVRDHGGWIAVTTALGAGTTMTLYLPEAPT